MSFKSLHELYMELVYRIYEDDIQSQVYYMSVIEDKRKIPVRYLIERNCLFVPNNEYLSYYLGDEVFNYRFELYRNEQCLWTLFFIFPVQDLSGEIVGLVGWDAQNKYLEEIGEGVGLPTYKVSSKNMFAKDKYFLSDINVLRKTFSSSIIFVVDGVFDSISLNYRGIPAISLLGSTVSPEVLYYLRWYKRIYVISDNDSAGLILYNKIRKSLPNVYRLSQNYAKDIEEALRDTKFDDIFSKKVDSLMQDISIKGDIYIT